MVYIKCEVKFTEQFCFCADLTSTLSILNDNTECDKSSVVQKNQMAFTILMQYNCKLNDIGCRFMYSTNTVYIKSDSPNDSLKIQKN